MTIETGPLFEPLPSAWDPQSVFLRCCELPHCVFLDSALPHPVLGRYSFVAADPFDMLEVPVDGRDGLGRLAARLAALRSPTIAGLPPFQGGAAGLFSYDLGRQLERLPAPRCDEFELPALAVGLYDVVFAFDLVDGRAWIVSQGFPESDRHEREKRARRRMAEAKRWLQRPEPEPNRIARRGRRPPLRRDQLARQFAVPGPTGLCSNMNETGYLAMIRRAIELIHAGDAFQVNLSQRLLLPARDDAVALYLRLRQCNPAPFAGYFDLGDFQVVSASPERFVQIRDGEVEARPIKGTRRRTFSPEADLFAGDELRRSEKDRAENVMIVDLLRNDLSRVCRPESVVVTQLCRLEVYRHVQHLVSAVRGRLADDLGAIDLMQAAFPGGSVTGAPKIRAMEIIAALEPTARGAYCGSLGYLGFDGQMDLSILIRTITAGRGWWQAPVGGGIVAQSDPRKEYEETWHKAEGLLRAVE